MKFFTRQQLQALITALVDLRFRHFEHGDQTADSIGLGFIHDVLRESGLEPTANTIPITVPMRLDLQKRQTLIDDFAKNRLSPEAFDVEMGKLSVDLCNHLASVIAKHDAAASPDGTTTVKKTAAMGWTQTPAPEDTTDEQEAKIDAVIRTASNRRKRARDERIAKLAATPLKAEDFLRIGMENLRNRAAVRDCPDGERSMAKTVAMFNIYSGHQLTETQGWQFMAILKMIRGSQGAYRRDDYQDQCDYSALAGESAGKEAANA